MTRAEFIVLAARFAKLAVGPINFVDVKEEHDWAAPSIATAVHYGWIEDVSGGAFRPDDPITRAEMVEIVNRMLGRSADADYIKANPAEIKQFTDLKDSSKEYYLDMIEASSVHNFIYRKYVEFWKK